MNYRMAASLPKLVFAKLPGAPVISVASALEAEHYTADDDQTSDILALTRRPDLPEEAKPKKEKPIETKKVVRPPKPEPAAQVEPVKSAKAPVEPVNVDLGKYDETFQEYAIDILGEEHKNPYKDKSASPIFPLQTRLGFQEQILRVYSDFIKVPEFGKEPDYDSCKKMASKDQQEVETYEYQKFVRDYVRQASPYRGLLVYHGLGSGKTCSAIAAAEALFSTTGKKIIVMTPFSLRDNFIRELTFCGFRHFRLQNHWIKLDSKNPLTYIFAQEILHLPQDYVKKRPDIWVPDFSQEANFKSLADEDRQQIVKQVQTQINNQITFLSYNGITATKLKEIACAPHDENGYGFFDNKVIVVDEIHNLIRLMQGTIEPYLTTLDAKLSSSKKRKVPFEPITPGPWKPALCSKVTDSRRASLTNYKRGYTLYRLLSTAKNSKIIGLSGTPLINFPEEIAILMNILGGYIESSSFTLVPANEQNKKIVETTLQSNSFIDFVEVKSQGMNMSVLFTLLPEGMQKVEGGVQRVAPGTPLKTIQQITTDILADLDSRGLKVSKTPIFTSHPLLPPIGEDFRKDFLEKDSISLKNTVVLRKRLQGLISYYRGSKKELMPQVTKDELVRVPMSPYSQAEYQRVRGEEISRTQEVKKKQGPAGDSLGVGGKMAALWAEFYDLTKMKQPNSYRMASRQAGNFAFPEGIVRPRPGTIEDATAELGTDKEIIDPVASGVEGQPEGQPKLQLEDLGENEVIAEQEDNEIDADARVAAIEEARERGETLEEAPEFIPVSELKANASEGELQPAVATGGGPEDEVGVAGKKTLSMANRLKAQRAKEQEMCKRGRLPGEDYEISTRRAKKCLETFATPKLRLFAPGKKIIDEVLAGTPPDPERLAKYSPKYAAILQKIIEAPGSSLVYSQFLDMEGIGIFLTVLKINEFQPIVIEADGAGSFRFSPLTVKSLEKGDKVFRYLSFTGGEDRELRSLALKVFNAKFEQGRFTELPPQISEVLVQNGFTGNNRGELCRVFCITSAGAEGLSLRNVRRVHIMEPYWNHVRTDQVKGRAVRICSHMDLDLEERNVEVYTYCSVYDSNALLHPMGDGGYPRIDQTLMNTDGLKPEDARREGYPIPEAAKEYIITSDEYLYTLSQKKKLILENIQNLMKTSAVDCLINQYENEEEGLGCIKIPGTPEQYAYHPILSEDIAYTSTMYKEQPLEDTSILEQQKGEVQVKEGSSSAVSGGPAPIAAPKPKQQTILAKVLTIKGVPYIVVPKKESASGLVLSFDIYARGDIKRTKRIGTMVASPDGGYTNDIVFF